MNEPARRQPGSASQDVSPTPAARVVEKVDLARPAVIVAEQQLEPSGLQAIREACAAVGAEFHAWKPTDHLEGLVSRAAAAIGTIGPGSRKIPSDLASLVTDHIPGLPLVLIAQEALVRPIVTLHDGLVTLVDAAPSSPQLARCLRALLAESPSSSIAPGAWWAAIAHPTEPTPLRRREFRVGASFIGVIDGPRAVATIDTAPITWLRAAAGVSAVVTPSREEPAPETGDLGGAAAFLQLEVGGSRLDWFFLVPHAGAALALFSTQRFPPFTDLGRLRAQGEGGSRRLAAAPGDIAVAIAPFDAIGPIASLGLDPNEGGTGLLDRLEAKIRKAAVACSCVVIEVR